MAITRQTFPGVYTTIKDDSFTANLTSRFKVGIAGVARKGPFSQTVSVRSLKEFRQNFGVSISGHFLANAVAMITDFTDGISVVRVGKQYERTTTAVSGGGTGSSAYKLYTPNAKLFNVGDFIRVSQGGKKTTVNAVIEDYIPAGDQANATGLQLVSTGSTAVALADVYTSGIADSSDVSGAANNAEAFLQGYVYSTSMTSLGNVTGNKSASEFQIDGVVLQKTISSITRSGTTATATCAGHSLITGNQITISGATESNFNGTVTITKLSDSQFTYTVADSGAAAATGSPVFVALAAGDLIRIVQDGKATTLEAQVKTVGATGEIILEPQNKAESGYQAVVLADNYTAGSIQKVLVDSDGNYQTEDILQLIAATAGTWANSDGVSTGLVVNIAPGSKAGTKKVLVYEDSALVETIDNLSTDSSSTDYYVTRINGNSAYIAIPTDDLGSETGLLSISSGPDSGEFIHPANTRRPWNTGTYETINQTGFGDTTYGWGIGYNGESPTAADIIGTTDPNTDEATGLQLFDNNEDLELAVIAVPGVFDLSVHQEMARIAGANNAIAFADIPDYDVVATPRQAIDWHNGAGLFSSRARIDDSHLALFFNWFQIVDQFDSSRIYVPPSLGALMTTARTFDREKPWYAAAGENRGIIDDSLTVRFPRISREVKAAMYGDGQSVNPILFNRGRRMLFGNRTMQVAESKLTAISNVILTNYVVNGMAAISRRFVFDPNDSELLLDLRTALANLLEQVKSERGIEEYELVIDSTNNTAETRNRREVIVDVQFVPVDPVERIYINATVRESGASLNSVTTESA